LDVNSAVCGNAPAHDIKTVDEAAPAIVKAVAADMVVWLVAGLVVAARRDFLRESKDCRFPPPINPLWRKHRWSLDRMERRLY
jgi:hypothetical protein